MSRDGQCLCPPVNSGVGHDAAPPRDEIAFDAFDEMAEWAVANADQLAAADRAALKEQE